VVGDVEDLTVVEIVREFRGDGLEALGDAGEG
jgi:hypothetical protein